jgi:hypothetical protein
MPIPSAVLMLLRAMPRRAVWLLLVPASIAPLHCTLAQSAERSKCSLVVKGVHHARGLPRTSHSSSMQASAMNPSRANKFAFLHEGNKLRGPRGAFQLCADIRVCKIS